jgi:arsenate reductase
LRTPFPLQLHNHRTAEYYSGIGQLNTFASTMITLYGIPNCDTMQKAFKWLDGKNVKYAFHNYKESGIDKATIEQWLKHVPLTKLINLKSTTYRDLTDSEKESISTKSKAIALMIKYPSIIKRPVWQLDKERFFTGWDEKALSALLEQ